MAVSHPVTARSIFRRPIEDRRAVVLLWPAFVALRLAVLPLTGAAPHDADDWMRLFEVRDFIAGQGWFDVTQYRIDPAHGGASMHWSRLVDLPLVSFVMLFSGFMPMAQAETFAMVIVPLLYLLAVMLALRSVMRSVGLQPPVIVGALALLPLFPLVLSQFAPMRIDHNVPQAVLATVCAALLLKNGDRAACWAGVVAASWAVISLEALPMVALLAALYGLRYALSGDRLLHWYLAMLTIASALLIFATRIPSTMTNPWCDVLMPTHVAAFALATVIAFALPWFPSQDSARGRILALAVIPLLCLPPVLVSLGGICAAGPMAQLDPMVRTWWYDHIAEGLPIWQQTVSVIAMMLWTAVIVAIGWYRARRCHSAHAPQWLLLALLAGGACLYSFVLMREALVAQLLAVPFAAMLLAQYWPRARAIRHAAPRIFASVACLLLVTPAFASAAGKPVDRLVQDAVSSPASHTATDGACNYARLASLPQGHVMATLDSGPEIIGTSPHTVVAASYHRNGRAMKAVLMAFTGPADHGVSIARAEGADYVVECLSRADTALYRTVSPDNLANALAGKNPIWGLEPAAGFESGALRVWRVTQP